MRQQGLWRRISTAMTSTVALAMLAAACQTGEATDKAGGEAVILRLASIDAPNNNGQSFGPEAFIENLESLSGGQITVEFTDGFGEGRADSESELVRAIAAGEVDGGWPATRAFAGAGIEGLEVVEAPMTISTYAGMAELVSGSVAEQLISRLEGTGLVGLGMTVGPLRRAFAADAPLLGPEDWEGIAFRVFNSPVQTDIVEALGATPRNLGFEWIEEIKSGALRGTEFDLAQYDMNNFRTEAGNVVTNVVLWPKVFVLVLSEERFNSLSAEQQEWVRQAGRNAVEVSATATYDEASVALSLCDKGVRFFEASTEQISGLKARLEPVLDGLANDPLLVDLQAIAAAHPGPAPIAVPASCQGSDASGEAGAIPVEASELPDGVYRVEITAAQLEEAGDSNSQGWSGLWTLSVSDATYQLSCRPLDLPGKDCGAAVFDGPLEAGNLRGIGSKVFFVPDAERLSELIGCKLPPSAVLDGHCGPTTPYEATWTTSGEDLRLTYSHFGDWEWSWTKIG